MIRRLFPGKFRYLALGFGFLALGTFVFVLLELWQLAALGALGALGTILVAVSIASLSVRRLHANVSRIRRTSESMRAMERRLEEVERRFIGTLDVDRASRYENFTEVREQLEDVEAELLSLREAITSSFDESTAVSEDGGFRAKAPE